MHRTPSNTYNNAHILLQMNHTDTNRHASKQNVCLCVCVYLVFDCVCVVLSCGNLMTSLLVSIFSSIYNDTPLMPSPLQVPNFLSPLGAQRQQLPEGIHHLSLGGPLPELPASWVYWALGPQPWHSLAWVRWADLALCFCSAALSQSLVSAIHQEVPGSGEREDNEWEDGVPRQDPIRAIPQWETDMKYTTGHFREL